MHIIEAIDLRDPDGPRDAHSSAGTATENGFLIVWNIIG